MLLDKTYSIFTFAVNLLLHLWNQGQQHIKNWCYTQGVNFNAPGVVPSSCCMLDKSVSPVLHWNLANSKTQRLNQQRPFSYLESQRRKHSPEPDKVFTISAGVTLKRPATTLNLTTHGFRALVNSLRSSLIELCVAGEHLCGQLRIHRQAQAWCCSLNWSIKISRSILYIQSVICNITA